MNDELMKEVQSGIDTLLNNRYHHVGIKNMDSSVVEFFNAQAADVEEKTIPIHIKGLDEDISQYVRWHIADIMDGNVKKYSPCCFM